MIREVGLVMMMMVHMVGQMGRATYKGNEAK